MISAERKKHFCGVYIVFVSIFFQGLWTCQYIELDCASGLLKMLGEGTEGEGKGSLLPPSLQHLDSGKLLGWANSLGNSLTSNNLLFLLSLYDIWPFFYISFCSFIVLCEISSHNKTHLFFKTCGGIHRSMQAKKTMKSQYYKRYKSQRTSCSNNML